MTPIRSKRTSRAPNRFSSDNARIVAANINGDSIIDYNDNKNSTNYNSLQISRSIKSTKSVTREPLKVKLPKLKRPQMQSSEEQSISDHMNQVKINKIKLPSFSRKRIKTSDTESDSSPAIKIKLDKIDLPTMPKFKLPKFNGNQAKLNSIHNSPKISNTQIQPNQIQPNSQVGSSKSFEKSLTQTDSTSIDALSEHEDPSFNSDNELEQKTEMIVSLPESPNNSGIHCPCGVDDDLGVMVECEKCSTWQHGHCINVGTEDDAYEGYICAYCLLPKEKVKESLHQLTVDDKIKPRLELLRASTVKNQTEQANETPIYITNAEISIAIKDLNRVLKSLVAKFRILTSQAYEIELRIWQNSLWSPSPQTKVSEEKNFYFMDKCRRNLKQNVCNMINKMEERYQLVAQAIKLAESKYNESNEGEELSECKNLGVALEELHSRLSEFKIKYDDLPN